MTAAIPAVNDPAQIAILGASSAEYLLQLALDQYAAKEFDAEQALELMAQQLATIEQQLAPIAALREQVRASMAGLMVDAGLTKAATAQAQLTLVLDTTTESFDAARLNSLIGDLLGRGHAGIATEIVATKKKNTRKGYLMIKPNKE
jgi:hypothetical protein